MRTFWRGIAAMALSATFVVGGRVAPISHAAPAQVPALTYVSMNGRVVVQENGTLTQVGPGQNPAWSPNGTNLLYMIANFAGTTGDLYVTDAHGANVSRLMTGLYPFVSPSWSLDSQYLVYTAPAAGANPTASSFTLEVRALRLATGKVQVLGHLPFAGGCSQKVTALQDAMGRAQGSYHGTPSTLIWTQPGMVVVQSNCTGQGLVAFKAGSTALTHLPTWSAGALAPDGKTVAGVVTPSAHGAAQIGLLTAATGKIQVLGPKIGAAGLTWSPDGKIIYAAVQPSDPKVGFAHVYHLSRDGKTVASLGMIQAAGIYHLAPDPSGKSLVMAVVASAAANVPAPPPILVYALSTQTSGQAQAIIPAVQPSWRP